ncbi:lamin tail domain-containing protein, partial [Candidatus Parcubacteria bacterium]|nr:lamin tail domain-containing protein [Candidatus Parcubacteria bacterium]
MEIRKFLKLNVFFILVIFLLPVFCYGYGNEKTHPALTNETVDVFNYYYYPTLEITNEQKVFLLKGSKEEDEPLSRPLNHFYDPVYERGLNEGLSVGMSAKEWSQDTLAQVKGLTVNIAGAGVIKDLFSSNSDYSWDRAVYDYVYGDKNRALEALGHTLHLIQDMSVPPHVRNDQHLVGSSPYETFTKDFDVKKLENFSDELIKENKKPVIENSLNDYFYKLASFTNGNFFSKDSIESAKYLEPKINFDLEKVSSYDDNISFVYNKVFNNLYKLIGVEKIYNVENDKNEISYFIVDDEKLILTDYWNILSEKAVLNGAGVVKLFFDEVEKEKKTLVLFNKNKSFLAEAGDAIKSFGSGLISVFSKADDISNNLAIISDVIGEGSDVNEGVNDETTNESDENDAVNNQNPIENIVLNETGQNENQNENNPQQNEEPTIIKLSAGVGLSQTAENNSGEAELPEGGSQIAFVGLPYPGFGGGGGGAPASSGDTVQQENNESDGTAQNNDFQQPAPEQTEITIPESPTILSPQNFSRQNSDAIIFSGLASTTNTIWTDFSEATTTPNENEEWLLTLNSFNQGTTTINFYASNENQTATSTPETIEIFVDSKAPDISLNIEECQNSLSQSGCLIFATNPTLNINWASNSEDFAYFTLNQNGEISTTTATSTQISLSGNQIYTFSVSATDNLENTSEPATQTVEINNLPIVINEISWAGTQADSSDEWIELYNNTNQDINLSNWILYSDDNSPNISLQNTIPAKGYYLIERKNGGEEDELTQSPIVDIPADLWVSFGAGLKNDGEELILARVDGNNSTTTIDIVPKINGWGKKGVSNTAKGLSMERYDSTQSSGELLENWSSSLHRYVSNGTDRGGNRILGTPKAKNGIKYFLDADGKIDSNRTLKKSESPYLITYHLTVSEGITLNIEAGVVIKFTPNSGPDTIETKGTIISNGTKEEPVVFTSLHDDEYGGDTRGDGICDPNNASSTAKCPKAGDWGQISIEPTSQNSRFDNTIFRYGGGFQDGRPMETKNMVIVKDTDVVFDGSFFENSKSIGLYLVGVSDKTKVLNGVFKNNNYTRPTLVDYPYGLLVSGGSPLIENNEFKENGRALSLGISTATVNSNIFNNNGEYAISSSGLNIFSGNSGENNGINGIMLQGG